MRLKITLLTLVSIFSLEARPLSVDVAAPSAILMNAETGAILYAKNIHERNFPASITKIATALYVLEKKGHALDELAEASYDAIVTVPAQARQAKNTKHPPYRLENGGTMIWLKNGEKVDLSSLLYGMMLESGNDAANVLAVATSGSVDRFCQELNSFLKQKGILETQFTNPHGLHHDEHWTTAYDMAKITRLAMRHPKFREIVRSTKYVKPETNMQKPQQFTQHNRLLKPGPSFYGKAIGVKTGYVEKAGPTFVGAAEHEGRTLIAVLLKNPDGQTRYRDTIKLFEAAFAEKKMTRTLFAQGSDLFSRQIRGADGVLKAALKDDVVLEYYPAEEPQFKAEIEWSVKEFPIAAGSFVGQLRCVDEKGNLLAVKPLYATTAISKRVWATVFDFCSAYKKGFLALFLGGQVILLLVYFLKKQQKIV